MSVIPEQGIDLLRSRALAHVATIGPRGEPQNNPVWFDWDGTYILFSQTKDRQKYHNVRRTPLVALSIVDPANPYRYLEVRGKVIRIDEDKDRAFINAMAKKYLGLDVFPWHQPEDERVIIVIQPQYTTNQNKEDMRRNAMTTSNGELQDGRADFDFLIGKWNIRHRRLREWLKGSTTWDEFEGTAEDRYILGGLGSISEVTLYLATGPLPGMTVRLFNPKSQQWSIYWINGLHGIMSTPMIGGFTQGRGAFYAQEIFEGKHLFSRFLWSDITATSCHWEQAFSVDGGSSWETNWIMDLNRQQE